MALTIDKNTRLIHAQRKMTASDDVLYSVASKMTTGYSTNSAKTGAVSMAMAKK